MRIGLKRNSDDLEEAEFGKILDGCAPRISARVSRREKHEITDMNRNTTSRSFAAAAAALAVGFLFVGCASTYTLNVDAMRATDSEMGQSYVIQSPVQETDEQTFGVASDLVRTALSGKGMYESANAAEADIVVAIDYGVGPGRMAVERLPGAAFDSSVPGESPVRNSTSRAAFDEFGSSGRGRVVGMPAQSVRSDDMFIITYVHTKFLSISARQNLSAGSPWQGRPEIWRVTVETNDGDDSIVEVLPVLAGAALDHIGNDTRIQQTTRVSVKSDPVAFVRRTP